MEVTDRQCSVEGCQGEVIAKGWCWKHYGRQRRYGSFDLPVKDTTRCVNGHDLTLPGSTYEWGACRKCQSEHYKRYCERYDGTCCVPGCTNKSRGRSGQCQRHNAERQKAEK